MIVNYHNSAFLYMLSQYAKYEKQNFFRSLTPLTKNGRTEMKNGN